MRLLVLTAVTACAVPLAACTHMPVSSMIKLARVDLATTDPGLLRAAVKLPRALRPQRMVLRIGVKLGSGVEEAQDFQLREVSAPEDVLVLHQELDVNTHIFAYQIEPTELGRLIAFRESLQQKRKARAGSGGSVTISIRPDACRTAELAGGPVYVTTYVRTRETGGYVLLARDVDLSHALSWTRSRGRNAPVRVNLEHDPEKWKPVFGKDHAPPIS